MTDRQAWVRFAAVALRDLLSIQSVQLDPDSESKKELAERIRSERQVLKDCVVTSVFVADEMLAQMRRKFPRRRP